jgi:hypothetical protein
VEAFIALVLPELEHTAFYRYFAVTALPRGLANLGDTDGVLFHVWTHATSEALGTGQARLADVLLGSLSHNVPRLALLQLGVGDVTLFRW